LSVTGATTTNGVTNTGNIGTETLTTTGLATLASLSVTGATTTNGITNTGDIGTGTLSTTGLATLASLSVTGATTTNGITNTGNVGTGTLSTTGLATLASLSVTGATTTNGITNSGNVGTGTLSATGGVNSNTGYQYNSTAPAGHYLRGDGSGKYVDGTIQSGDLPANLSLTAPVTVTCKASDATGTSLNANDIFMNFNDKDGNTRGQIQGQSYNDYTSNYAFGTNLAVFLAQSICASVQIITAIGTVLLFAPLTAATVLSFATLIGIPEGAYEVVNILNMAIDVANVVAQVGNITASLVSYIVNTAEQVASLGVQYGSSAADYAEYLKLENPSDNFNPGDVVGVRNGLISKNTDSAQNIFAISTAPLVVGNEPPKGEEMDYTKVGFLGQVPVKVHGPVHEGDFIVASGLNDGFGIAIPPGEMTPRQFTTVLGRAWDNGENTVQNVVNVAIGLSARDMSEIVSRQQTEIDSLQRESGAENASLTSMNARLATLSMALAEPNAAKRQMLLAQSLPKNASVNMPFQAGTTRQAGAAPRNNPIQNTGKRWGALPLSASKVTQSDLPAQVEKLTNDAANNLLASGQPLTAAFDKISKLPSFVALQKRVTANIAAVLASPGPVSEKRELLKKCLTAPTDQATRQAYGACVMEAMPLMKSVINSANASTTPSIHNQN
ncbi:MAG: hypothetical protein ACREBW_03600, partial [Candidatus Micrarchaeaceae archaeon]